MKVGCAKAGGQKDGGWGVWGTSGGVSGWESRVLREGLRVAREALERKVRREANYTESCKLLRGIWIFVRKTVVSR